MTSAVTDSLALLEALSALAGQADLEVAWPSQSWELLQRLGGGRWCIAHEFGGLGLAGVDLLDQYEHLASTCLTTAFILSQRDAACRRIRDYGSVQLCRQLLPSLAAGKHFATVGVSHLTTSRQHLGPTMVTRDQGDHFILDGLMPWVTGAAQADYVVTGGTLDDGRQILGVLPTRFDGVHVGPPLELMALAGSITAEIRCAKVKLPRQWLLAGPTERVLTQGRGGAGGLETSCLALGLARAAVEYLGTEAGTRPSLRANFQRLQQAANGVRQDLRRFADEGGPPEQHTALRARANALVLRATQAALAAAKGTGFLRQHPAQRWARQALFFLVWSCPAPAAEATLAYLHPPDDQECSH
jgi:alkylation response protein AidB-like acyl-CoA dehydrogenase